MARSGQSFCGTIQCGSDAIITSTQDDLDSEAKKQVSRIVSVRYTSAGQSIESQTINGHIPDYSPSLPTELDIFSNLSEVVYKNIDVRDFLNDFRTVIVQSFLESGLENIVLSKLTISEITDSETVIDWVFNYFQMYFSFDKNNGDYWGTIMANNEEGEFCNSVIKIRPEKRLEQVKSVLATAVMLIR